MKYPESKGIRGGNWYPNEMLTNEDINFVSDSQYTNFISKAISVNPEALDNNKSVVLSGLEITADTLLTLKLSPGEAISPEGSYLTDQVWGFNALAGDVFGVVSPIELSPSVTTADPVNPRIDVIEVRPIQTYYDSKSRQYKDPITGLVTASNTNTKVEYGCEFQVSKGTAAVSPTAPSKTAGWIKIAEVNIPASATVLTAKNIITYIASEQWEGVTPSTVPTFQPEKLERDVSISISSPTDYVDILGLLRNVPLNLNGHRLSLTMTVQTWSDVDDFPAFHDGTISIANTGNINTGGDTWEFLFRNCDVAFSGPSSFVNTAIKISGKNNYITVLSYFDCQGLSVPPLTIIGAIKCFLTFSISDSLGTNTALYGVSLDDCQSVFDLPQLTGTPANFPDYHVLLKDTVIIDSSNLSNGTLGDIHSSSSKYILLDKIGYRVSVDEDTLLQSKTKYIINGNYELTLPASPSEGDTIDILSEGYPKITQNDANHSITHKGKYQTTKGTSGWIQMFDKERLTLSYKGSGLSKIEPGIKITDPATIPPNSARAVVFSYNGIYMAVGNITTSPYAIIYKLIAGIYVALVSPFDVAPSANVNGVAFSYDGVYFAIAGGSANNLIIYKRSGDVFTKLTDPVTLPTGTGLGVNFSYDSNYLFITHVTTPYVTVYKRSGDVFTKLTDPSTTPTGTGRGVAVSYDGNYVVCLHSTSPYITLYKRNEDVFTKLSNLTVLPTNTAYAASFSFNGSYLAVGASTTPFIFIYKKDGNTYVPIDSPKASMLPTSTVHAVKFSFDEKYLIVSEFNTPYIHVYKKSGDTFIELTDPSVIPTGSGYSCDMTLDMQHMTVAHNITPFVTIYKMKEAVTKQWVATDYEVMNPDTPSADGDLKYRFK